MKVLIFSTFTSAIGTWSTAQIIETKKKVYIRIYTYLLIECTKCNAHVRCERENVCIIFSNTERANNK